MIDAFAIAASRPWVIQPEALETVLSIANGMGDPQALQAKLGRPLENTRRVSVRDGVAVIPVTGPIFRYANLFTEISGATSTGVLARDIQTALDNPYIRGIVLEMNSPGGEATGINELAKQIRAGSKHKRIVAYGGGAVASGAYWLAAACSEIVVDESAMLGSIGVVMSYLDTRKRDEKSDVRAVDIVSSQSPDKRIDPNTDEGRSKVQAVVDAMADVFVSAVADFRKTTPDNVLAEFGRGGVLIGKAAVKAGMADRTGSLETVIAELAGSASNSKRGTTMSSNNGQVTVSTTEDLRNALAAGKTPDQIAIASNDQAVANARAAGVEEGKKASTDIAVAAERKRIADVQALAREGFEAELKTAIDDGHSPEAFALSLMKAATERGITLDAMRKGAPAAASHGGKPEADAGKGQPRIDTKSIFDQRHKAMAGTSAR